MNWGLNSVALVVSVRKGPPLRMLWTKYRCTGNPAVTIRTTKINNSSNDDDDDDIYIFKGAFLNSMHAPAYKFLCYWTWNFKLNAQCPSCLSKVRFLNCWFALSRHQNKNRSAMRTCGPKLTLIPLDWRLFLNVSIWEFSRPASWLPGEDGKSSAS